MEDHAGDASLFEGMNFVLSVTPEEELLVSEAEVGKLSSPKGIDSAQAQPADNVPALASMQQAMPLQKLTSEPLDADLFTGLSMSSEVSSAIEDKPSEKATVSQSEILDKHVGVERNGAGNGFESILAAYDDVEGTVQSTHSKIPTSGSKPAAAPKASGRKKKRSLRIGYGRDNEDLEDIPQNRERTPSEADSRKSTDVIDVLEFEASLHDKEGSLGDGIYGSRLSFSNSEISQGDIELDLDEKVLAKEQHKEFEQAESAALEAAQEEEISSEAVEERETTQPSSEGVLENNASSQDKVEVNTVTMTIEQRLQAIKQTSQRKLKDLEAKTAVASASRKVAGQIRRQAAAKLSAAAAKRKDLEAELESACESEDFELADKLSKDVAEAEKLLESAEMSFKEAELKYDSAAFKVEEIIISRILIEEEGADAFIKLQAEADAAAEKVTNEADEPASREIEKWTMEEEQLAMKKKEHVLQLRALEEANAELAIAINESIQPEVHEKESLVAERQVLVEELQELLEKVKAKEAEIAKRDKCIEEINARISNVADGFQDKQEKLQTDSKKVACLLEALEQESLNIELAKRKVEEQVASAEAERQNLENAAVSAKAEAAMLRDALDKRKRVAAFTRDIKEKKILLVKKEEELLAEAQALRQEASAARASLQELSSTKIRLQQDISAAKQKKAYLEKRGPELDAEKRLAAAARNFKEAARLSAEAKALMAEKEAAIGEVQKSTSDLHKLQEDIEAKILALANIEVLIGMKEKDAAQACCERLRLVAIAARDERDVAIELNDLEEAENLQAEADAADAEADELQRIHQFQGEQYEKNSRQQDSAAVEPDIANDEPGEAVAKENVVKD